jgi:hypothetical protein
LDETQFGFDKFVDIFIAVCVWLFLYSIGIDLMFGIGFYFIVNIIYFFYILTVLVDNRATHRWPELVVYYVLVGRVFWLFG